MTSRNGKIARLSAEIRDEVNERLQDGESGKVIVVWLNGLPEVKKVMAQWFEGKAITEQNLSEWRQGGFVEWEERWRLLEDVEEASTWGMALGQGYEDLVAELTSVLAGRYAQLLLRWDGEVNEEVKAKVRLLGRLNRDVLALQRGQQREVKLGMARSAEERLAHDFKERVETEQNRKEVGKQAAVAMREFLREEMAEQKAETEREHRTSNTEHPTSNSEGGNPHPSPLPSDGRGGATGRATAKGAGLAADSAKVQEGENPGKSERIKPNRTIKSEAGDEGKGKHRTSNTERPTSNGPAGAEGGEQWN